MASHEEAATLQGKPLLLKESELLKRFTVKETQISQRYFECPDVDLDWAGHEIYYLSEKNLRGADIEERNLFYGQKSLKAIENMYDENDYPDHLIHVTCTGYVAPSPAQIYFSKKSEGPAITHAYHMGCYASLPAVRMGMALISSQLEKKVDIVHTEICSLHLDPFKHTPEQMVVQSLFADGHIRYRMDEEKKGMRVLSVLEKIIPDSLKDMTWIPGAFGMVMELSKNVPGKIESEIQPFLNELFLKSGLERIRENLIFAIHPGGPKIIDAVQKNLELNEEQIKASRKVLYERGNMSSATLPHVWKEILDSKPKPGTLIVSLAFGPGLTIFGALFEVVES